MRRGGPTATGELTAPEVIVPICVVGKKKKSLSRTCGAHIAIPAPGRLGQEDCYEFEASLRSAEENTDYALRKNHQNFTTAKK